MAMYHCSISNVSRSKGASSCATLAYIIGEKIRDERLGKTFNYSRKERVLYYETLLPDYAPSDFVSAQNLFNFVEKSEQRDNARVAKKIEVALPRELTIKQQQILLKKYINENFIKFGYCATYAIHNDPKNHNPHGHILVSNKPINKKGEFASVTKSEFLLDENGNKIPVIDEKTGRQKERIRKGKGVEKIWKRVNVEQNPLDTRDFLKKLRENWANVVNFALEKAGFNERVDHRTLEAQGISRKATIHEGYAAQNIEKKGGIAERCSINREIKKSNAEAQAKLTPTSTPTPTPSPAPASASVPATASGEKYDIKNGADLANSFMPSSEVLSKVPGLNTVGVAAKIAFTFASAILNVAENNKATLALKELERRKKELEEAIKQAEKEGKYAGFLQVLRNRKRKIEELQSQANLLFTAKIKDVNLWESRYKLWKKETVTELKTPAPNFKIFIKKQTTIKSKSRK